MGGGSGWMRTMNLSFCENSKKKKIVGGVGSGRVGGGSAGGGGWGHLVGGGGLGWM